MKSKLRFKTMAGLKNGESIKPTQVSENPTTASASLNNTVREPISRPQGAKVDGPG
jgi:hypothetical protein